MGAGKTTELIKTYDIYKRKGLNPIVIKPAIDDREGKQVGWGVTKSRITSEEIPAYYYTDLQKELPQLQYDSLMVDEAQFMSEEDVRFIATSVDKPILAYGLRTDVNGRLFEGAAALLAFADNTKELENLCQFQECTNKAQMHLRFIDGVLDRSGKSVAIDKDNVTYMSVCRKCWGKTTR